MDSVQNRVPEEERGSGAEEISAVKEEAADRGSSSSGQADAFSGKTSTFSGQTEAEPPGVKQEGEEEWTVGVKEEPSPVRIGSEAESPAEIEVNLELGSESEESSENRPGSHSRGRKRAHPFPQEQLREMEEPSALVDFLRERGISEDLIQRMETDKIDVSVIPLMAETELQQYIPHYGDRLAVIDYCLNNQPPERRTQMMDRLQTTLFGPREEVSRKHMGNTYAKKKARRVELGWMNYNEKSCNFKQVRTANGGGTKHISINKQAKLCDVQKMAERIFFPTGASRFFYLKDVDCDIRDFSHRRLDQSLTVEDLYKANKAKIVRLYLFTKKRNVNNGVNNGTNNDVNSVPSSLEFSQGGSSSYSQLENGDFGFRAAQSQTFENHQTSREGSNNTHGTVRFDQGYDETYWEELNPENSYVANTEWMVEHNNEDSLNNSDVGRIVPHVGEVPTSTGNAFTIKVGKEEELGTPAEIIDCDSFDDTVSFEDDTRKLAVVVRRGSCLKDMMAAFNDPTIMDKDLIIHMKLPNGALETQTGPGVFRDCLSEFWSEFYHRCTLGADVKAPLLRHEFQAPEWQAIARVLVKGWLSEKYFPVHLPLPFLEQAFYGTIYSSVTDAFMLYVSKNDREVLRQASNDFLSVDEESLLDVLGSYECHRRPTAENLVPLLSQLGHKALIQAPTYVIQCWKPVLADLARTLSPKKLVEIIEERVPSPKKVNTVLKFPEDMNAQQTTVSRNLKRYIREIDEGTLERFLRFCTGADVLFGKDIAVQFSEKKDLECRPQAHMCSCLLVLPVKYQNYPDLRSGFSAVLNNSVSVMNII
ncbi:hypothetical protein AMEX_G22824 [Astyanax mexicanus]|uniref:HECT domain-containing protein n=1 Tax=Astyanax mexicanus TaxID=7994 RepID=A0A8T2KZ18_ASTMX|nr:hypothetical protein AMEX_G22824 [Astyanax mexicanus]